MTLQRRERPKIFLDKAGRATWLYNGVGLDSGNRPFMMNSPTLNFPNFERPNVFCAACAIYY
jgi:hypothetical protein